MTFQQVLGGLKKEYHALMYQKVKTLPNFDDHLLAGLLTGLIYGTIGGILPMFYSKLFSIWIIWIVFGVSFSAFGSIFPDLLEPPVHPHHRKGWHSVCLLFFFVYLAICGIIMTPLLVINTSLLSLPLLAGFIFGMIGSFAAGYSSHLVLDASTPAGLPLEPLGEGRFTFNHSKTRRDWNPFD